MSKEIDEIAIIGLSGRFPGCKSIDDYWHNLCRGVELISHISPQDAGSQGIDLEMFNQSNYVNASGILSDIDLFDAPFFDFSPREAELTDPQHRLFLECAWTALENAGYDPQTYNGRIGVYAGESMNTYLLANIIQNPSLMKEIDYFQALIGNDRDFLTTQIAYKLNLKGPSITIQTACSTSLVAVHIACQSLFNGECDIALAGGASVKPHQNEGYIYREGGILSLDGHCRAFDANAKGTVVGNGVGIVVLKCMEAAVADRDHILAIIKGSAINNDGSTKLGYTAPSVKGQAAVIAEALVMSNVEAETITYIEAHGTGTPLGDPIEVAALTQAFRNSTDAKDYCAIGSVKTNIGHLDAAAGVAGLIKTALALKNRKIPPSLNFTHPNPQIDFMNSPFYVNTSLKDWPNGKTPRRAGVSSFGIGGTNAHVVLEEASPIQDSDPSRSWQILVLSAKTSSALEKMTTSLAEYLKQHLDINLADIAYTLQVGRKAFKYRLILVCSSHDDAIQALETRDPNRVFMGCDVGIDRPITFMFPGQGTQYVRMAADLYQHEPTFRSCVDLCAQILEPQIGIDLRDVLYPKVDSIEQHTKDLNQTSMAQPALFVIEYALAKLWMEWGIFPQAMVGHSIGEYVAACLSGVFSLEHALMLIAARGQLMQNLPIGAMIAVACSEEQSRTLLDEQISLAAVNGPSMCVLSGSIDAVEKMERRLTTEGVIHQRLQTSHAFHSIMTEPILQLFVDCLKDITLNSPQIPYLSNLTGTWITNAQATDPYYWMHQLRHTVRFSENVHELSHKSDSILLEVGPGQTLSSLAGLQAKNTSLTSLRHPRVQQSDEMFLLSTFGRLWLVGAQVKWSILSSGERRNRIPLPTYPFEYQRYWLNSQKHLDVNKHQSPSNEGTASSGVRSTLSGSLHPRPDLQNNYVAPHNEIEQSVFVIWQELLGIEHIGVHDSFFELGGHSLMGVQLLSRLKETFRLDLSLNNLFEMPTIAYLATIMEGKLIEKIEALSEEEAQYILQTLTR